MKFLAVFLLVCLAFASAVPIFDDDIENELDQIADELGDEFILYAEGGLVDWFRSRFEELLNKLEKDSEDGKGIPKTLMERAEYYYEKLKKLGVEISERYQKLFEELKNKFVPNAPQHADFKELLRKLRERLQNHEFDEEKIRTFIERIFGQSEISNQFLEMLKSRGEQGKQRIIDFINRILGDKQEALAGPILDRMQQEFEKMMEKMQKSFEDGKVVSENMWKKAQDVYEKLKNLGVEFSEKIQQIYDDMKARFEKQSSEQFSIISRIKERLESLISRMHKDVEDGKGVRGDLMKKLTDVFEKFRNLGGEMSQKFKDMMENIRSKFDKSSPPQHSVKEIYEKVKKFFKDLNIELKEKFVKFGEYVKEQYHKALDQTKSKVENVKNIANKFVDDGRQISKDLAEEALEFFRPYKEDLGTVWEDVVDKVRNILNKQD